MKVHVDPGDRFGKLTFVMDTGERRRGYRVGLFICDCGRETRQRISGVKGGHPKACGCSNPVQIKHGMTDAPEFISWSAAKNRCRNENYDGYRNYGGRGITMCAEWQVSFAAFYEHIGPRPLGTTLDRIENDKGYEPGNVRWATPSQQIANRRKK